MPPRKFPSPCIRLPTTTSLDAAGLPFLEIRVSPVMTTLISPDRSSRNLITPALVMLCTAPLKDRSVIFETTSGRARSRDDWSIVAAPAVTKLRPSAAAEMSRMMYGMPRGYEPAQACVNRESIRAFCALHEIRNFCLARTRPFQAHSDPWKIIARSTSNSQRFGPKCSGAAA